MKAEQEMWMNRIEMNTITGWMSGIKLTERKRSQELRELLGLEPASLMIKKSWLRWFGHVEHKDDTDWVKRCMTMKIEGIRKRGRQKKIRWDSIYDDVES